jgi:hypothetical protein
MTAGCVTAIGNDPDYRSIYAREASCTGGTIIAASNGILYRSLTISGNSIVFNNRNAPYSFYGDPEVEAPAIHLMNPEAVIDPNGNITLNTNLTVPPGSTLTIPPGSTFTLSEGITLNNEGTVNNYGTVDSRNGRITGNISNKENGKVLTD